MAAQDLQFIGIANLNWKVFKANPFYSDLLATTIFLGSLAVLGLLGNILVIKVFTSRENESVYRTVILTLAIYDALLCGITIPFEIYDLHNQYTFQGPEWVCKLVRTLNYFLVFNSGVVVLLMTVDRFRRVCRPLSIQITLSIARAGILFICLVSFIFSLPNLWIRGIQTIHLGINETGHDCTISSYYINSKVPMIYFSILLILCTLIIVILIILYIMIGHKIVKHFRFRKKFLYADQKHEMRVSTISLDNGSTAETDVSNVDNSEVLCRQSSSVSQPTSINKGNNYKTSVNNKKPRKYSGKKMDEKGLKATKIAIMISVMYILSYIPTLTENVLEAVYGVESLSLYVSSSVLHLLRKTFAINHAINPIIYGFIDEKFRENCRTVIMAGCKRCRG